MFANICAIAIYYYSHVNHPISWLPSVSFYAVYLLLMPCPEAAAKLHITVDDVTLVKMLKGADNACNLKISEDEAWKCLQFGSCMLARRVKN